MPLVLIGTVLLALKLLEVGPVANWSWLWVAAPFGAAVAWWAFADTSGYTQRRAIEKMEKRKIERRERDMAALGLDPRRDRRGRLRTGAAPAPAPAPKAESPSRAADERL